MATGDQMPVGMRKRKRKSRWNEDPDEKANLPTVIPEGLDPEQEEQYLGEHKKLAKKKCFVILKKCSMLYWKTKLVATKSWNWAPHDFRGSPYILLFMQIVVMLLMGELYKAIDQLYNMQ